jgi:hypothetical protein
VDLNNVLDSLFHYVLSRKHANELASVFESFVKQIYSSSEDVTQLVPRYLPLELGQWFMSSLKMLEISGTDRVRLEGLMQGVVQALRGADSCEVVLPFYPRAVLYRNIVEFVRKSRGTAQVLVEVDINPFLVGGAVVTTSGKRLDLSLRKRFLDFMLNEMKDSKNNDSAVEQEKELESAGDEGGQVNVTVGDEGSVDVREEGVKAEEKGVGIEDGSGNK